MKKSRSHRCEGKYCSSCTNPRVVLRPLGDPMVQTCYRFTTTPPVASLFKRQELSDIKLKVGDDMYYAHRLILCSASEVFSKMLNADWAESKKDILELEEDDECVKVFDRFLKYLYSGSTVISESYVIPLFMLSDKYDVPALYNECVKVIENGLKVYSAPVKNVHMMFGMPPGSPDSASSGDSSENEYMSMVGNDTLSQEDDAHASTSSASSSNPRNKLHLVASETFALGMVIKLFSYCTNKKISEAALYNMEARLSNQISQDNHITWNVLEQSVITQMLQDDNFYCSEYVLFRAAKSWLEYDELRQSDKTKAAVLCEIRYPIMDTKHLYEVENDKMILECSEAKNLVHQALRYKVFSCQSPRACDQEKWQGKHFQPRAPK
jgi:hypothetical protein